MEVHSHTHTPRKNGRITVLTLNNIKGINMGIRRRMENLKRRAIEIRQVIINEYHLE